VFFKGHLSYFGTFDGQNLEIYLYVAYLLSSKGISTIYLVLY